jgi:diguanylate cyclase (GGDEF)-like protein
MKEEVNRAYRYGRGLSVFFLDLDHFKAINDRFGHMAGDSLLTEFALLICNEIRQVDLVGRYGGEEFLVIMPEIEPAQALDSAERLRARVAAHHFRREQGGEGLSITVSIGIATIPANGQTMEEIIDAADRAMYRAKQAGRNRVCMASREPHPASTATFRRKPNA